MIGGWSQAIVRPVSGDRVTTARTYIVRLYRRPRGGQQRLAGLVEIVPGGGRRSFSSFQELKAILCPPVSPAASREAAPRSGADSALSKRQPSKRR
jgi:hypothetical protein